MLSLARADQEGRPFASRWVSVVLNHHQPVGRFIVPIVLGLALASLLVNLQGLARSLDGNAIYTQKDIIQEWLLAKSILNGVDPYQTTETLAQHFLGPVPDVQNGAHPTPHPPTVGLIFLPLAFLNYRAAVYVWLVLEVACLFGALYAICRTYNVRRSAVVSLVLLPAALSWGAVADDLMLGQLVIVQLFLLAVAGLCVNRARPVAGAVCAGRRDPAEAHGPAGCAFLPDPA